MICDGGSAASCACCIVQMADIIAKQRRVERQDKAAVEGVSFDRAAANAFQQYCNSALAFSIKRGGICYGTGGWLGCASSQTHNLLSSSSCHQLSHSNSLSC